MLSLERTDDCICPAYYAKDSGEGKPMPIFIHREVDAMKMISGRCNHHDYIEARKIFPTMHGANTKGDISRIMNIVYKGIREGKTAEDMHPEAQQYFKRAMNNVAERLPFEFIAEGGCSLYPGPTQKRNQRDAIIVTGPSGCGKSWWAGHYCSVYHYVYPDRKIYLFTMKPRDEAYDSHNFITRVPVREMKHFISRVMPTEMKEVGAPKAKRAKKTETVEVSIYDSEQVMKNGGMNKSETNGSERPSGPPSCEYSLPQVTEEKEEEKEPFDFGKALYIFDDVEHIPDDIELPKFRLFLTQVGRSVGVDVLLCNHMALDYSKTRTELLECSLFVMFPKHGITIHARRFMTNYGHFEKEQIDRAINEKYQWVAVSLAAPRYVVTSKEMWCVKNIKN
jgi:hypothetical protein